MYKIVITIELPYIQNYENMKSWESFGSFVIFRKVEPYLSIFTPYCNFVFSLSY